MGKAVFGFHLCRGGVKGLICPEMLFFCTRSISASPFIPRGGLAAVVTEGIEGPAF